MTWDGTAFRNAAKNAVLCYGRANAYTAAFPVNPLAPTDRWILVESSGYMSVGPAGDLPTGDATSFRYQMEWSYYAGNWVAHSITGATISNVNLETAPGIVTNFVARHYQPVATVEDVDAVAETARGLGAAIADVPATIDAALAQLPQNLRALVAQDDRADTLRVSRTNTVQRQDGVTVTGGTMSLFGFGPDLIAMTWDGARFYGEWAPGQEDTPVSVVGWGRDAVTLPGRPVNPLAPTNAWLFVTSFGWMAVGPAGDLPYVVNDDPDSPFTPYALKFEHGDDGWHAVGDGGQLYPLLGSVTTAPRMVDVEETAYEPVLTAPDLRAVDMLCVARTNITLHPPKVEVLSGWVEDPSQYGSRLTWNGTRFEGTFEHYNGVEYTPITRVLGWGREAVTLPGWPVNPLAPAEGWLLADSTGYMCQGPATGKPCGFYTGDSDSCEPYYTKWYYSAGNWVASTGDDRLPITTAEMETREIDMTEIDVRYLPVATLEDLEPASFDAATNMLTFSTHPQRVTIPAGGSLKVSGTWPEGARVFCVISTPTSFTLGTGVAVANNGTLTANRNIHAYAWRVGAKYYIQPVHTETK